MAGRQESTGPVGSPAVGKAALVGQDDKRRQSIGFVSQAVGQPTSEGGKTIGLESAVLQEHCRSMVATLGVHRVDDREVVGAGCEMWEEI